MKVAILNYIGEYVEIAPIPENLADKLRNNLMQEFEVMAELGYDLDNIQYMFVDTDPDGIDVFYQDDPIPVTTL